MVCHDLIMVSVLIPLSGNCPYRTAAWRYVHAWYRQHHPDFQVVCGVVPSTLPWCKATAVSAAACQAEGEVYVIADADCFSPSLDQAVSAVHNDWQWAMPHYTVNRLSKDATYQVYQGHDPAKFPRNRQWYAQLPYVGFPGGGITVVRRQVYEQAPLDPRFVGWGQEDEAWALALRSLYGRPWRPSRSPLWHLWHPPQRRMTRSVGSERSRDMLRQYKEARTKQQMTDLLEPARRAYREMTGM